MESLGRFEITYFGCRPTPDVPERRRDRAFGALSTDLGWVERPLGDLYDTAAVDSQLLRRFDITGLAVDAYQSDGWLDCGFGPPEVRATALFASFNFVVLGITLDWKNAPHPTDDADLANLAASWYGRLGTLALIMGESAREDSKRLKWTLDALGHVHPELEGRGVVGDVRDAIELVGCVIHETLTENGSRGKSRCAPQPGAGPCDLVVPTCTDFHRAGELMVTDVHTWGFHANFRVRSDSDTDDCPETTLEKMARDVERALMQPRVDSWGGTQLARPVVSASGEIWLLRDHESVRCEPLTAEDHAEQIARASERDRCREFVEYLALRRGTVSALQRSVTRDAAIGNAVSGAAVNAWTWLLALVGNDHLLAGFALERMRQLRERVPYIDWHIVEREAALRRNLDALAARLESRQGRMAAVFSAVVAVIGAAAVFPLAAFALAWMHGEPTLDEGALSHPVSLVTLLGVVGAGLGWVAWMVLRRSRHLRPPKVWSRR